MPLFVGWLCHTLLVLGTSSIRRGNLQTFWADSDNRSNAHIQLPAAQWVLTELAIPPVQAGFVVLDELEMILEVALAVAGARFFSILGVAV